jgi:protein-S-isoprenylcysteine O-methyltransferase Ste14
MNPSIIMIMVSILWLGSEIILIRVKHSQPTDSRFDRSSLRILWITIIGSETIGVFLGFQRVGHFGKGSLIFPYAGIILVICGLLFRWFAILSLKHQFTVDVSIRKDHRIVSDGIYRVLRHPSYAGSLLSLLGLGLFFANYLSILVIFLPTCSAFLYRIHIEEKALIETFGDEYLRYCHKTKRLIPGIF